MLIPYSELAARMTWPDDAVMNRVSRRSESLQLLRGYLRSLESRRLSAWRDARETIRRHLIDLAALALTQNRRLGESSLSAVAAARLTAALDLIATCYQRPDFNVATAAKSQGISQRYLQRLLEASGTFFHAARQ